MDISTGVKVILTDFQTNPACPHGPTILFQRTVNGEEEKFYSCSACRDRKDCKFFLNYGEEWSAKKQEVWAARRKRILPRINHGKLSDRFKLVSQLPVSDRSYCHSCSRLILPEDRSNHESHDVTNDISDYQLSHPSELLKPLESSKKEAQYLFAPGSTRAIVDMLRSAGVRYLLCVGAPRIHEWVTNAHPVDMKSLLLDVDPRFHQFYGEAEFAWFNTFNCHWFLGEQGKSATVQFMQQASGNQLALVTDPPFGGRIEPLAYTFQCIDDLHKELHPDREGPLPLMWIFPYFMEPMILHNYPSMSMLDYKVDYENHPLFQQGQKGRKYGSPVRIFTNIPASKLPLPKNEGYEFCEFCEKWVSKENKHCFKCSNCTSKNGRTYVHCDLCTRCVKPTWKHCKQCQRCCLPDHICGEFKPINCFACHKPGHKKNDCPLRITSEETNNANRKRNKKPRQSLQRHNLENGNLKEKGHLGKRKYSEQLSHKNKRKLIN